jgi:hypothetical protein
MLRLKHSLGSRVLSARGVKTWHKDLEAPLKRVGARIDAALQVLPPSELQLRSLPFLRMKRNLLRACRNWPRFARSLSNGAC